MKKANITSAKWFLTAVLGMVGMANQARAWPHYAGYQGFAYEAGSSYACSYGPSSYGGSYYPYFSYYQPYGYQWQPPAHYFSHFPAYGAPYSYNYQLPQSYQVYSSGPVWGPWLGPAWNILRMPDRRGDWANNEKRAAWEYLAAGEHDEASAIFAAMERQLPGSAWPRVGSGLLAGFSGDYSQSLYCFRRGFGFDPDGPGTLPRYPELVEKLETMANHFRRAANRDKPNADAEFMVAALAYLLGDNLAAQNAIEKAIAHGDDSRSARHLKEMILLANMPGFGEAALLR